MNATTYDMAPETTLAEFDFPKTPSFSVVLPYLALLVTLAAFFGNAPAKVAALVRNERAPGYSLQEPRVNDMIASSVSYPVLGHDALVARAVPQWSRLLRR
jgi:hypothetical protein